MTALPGGCRDLILARARGEDQAARRSGGGPIGILSLQTRFPRIPGDVGCPDSYDLPVIVRQVPGATPDRVVHERAAGLLDAFAAAGRQLVAEGARGLVTTCGFLVLHQDALQRRLPVPLATSALLQIPLAERQLPPGCCVGVVTASAAALSPDHLAAAGADPATPVEGVDPAGEIARVFLGDAPDLDRDAAERDVVAAARRLAARARLGALVLECGNMGPYAPAVRAATGLPVYDAITLVRTVAAGLP